MKELLKYTIITTKLIFDSDGDWIIDYTALSEYKNLHLSLKNDSGFFTIVYNYHVYDGDATDEDYRASISKIFSIANDIFVMKEHKGSLDVYGLFPNLKIGKQSNGNYSLKIKCKATTKLG